MIMIVRKMLAPALAVLLLAGCGGTTGTASGETPRGTNAPSSSETNEWDDVPVVSDSPSAEDSGNDTTPLGETFEWEDHLSVTVSKPKAYKPSEYAATEDADHYVVMTVRIVNETGKPFDVNSFYTSVQSGNEEASEVFDSDKGLEGSPSTKLLDGREVEFEIGYGVSDTKDLVVQVTPSYDYEAAIFTS